MATAENMAKVIVMTIVIYNSYIVYYVNFGQLNAQVNVLVCLYA